jgi:hypothetical protein
MGGEPLADAVVAGELIFAAPAVEAEALRPSAAARSNNDRAGVAQPDVAEWLDDDRGERRQLAGARSCVFVRGDQPNFLACPSGVNRSRKNGDFAFSRLQVGEPQLRIGRESYPHRLVRRPLRQRRLSH